MSDIRLLWSFIVLLKFVHFVSLSLSDIRLAVSSNELRYLSTGSTFFYPARLFVIAVIRSARIGLNICTGTVVLGKFSDRPVIRIRS